MRRGLSFYNIIMTIEYADDSAKWYGIMDLAIRCEI